MQKTQSFYIYNSIFSVMATFFPQVIYSPMNSKTPFLNKYILAVNWKGKSVSRKKINRSLQKLATQITHSTCFSALSCWKTTWFLHVSFSESIFTVIPRVKNSEDVVKLCKRSLHPKNSCLLSLVKKKKPSLRNDHKKAQHTPYIGKTQILVGVLPCLMRDNTALSLAGSRRK